MHTAENGVDERAECSAVREAARERVHLQAARAQLPSASATRRLGVHTARVAAGPVRVGVPVRVADGGALVQ